MHLADLRLGWSPRNAPFSITDGVVVPDRRRRKVLIYAAGAWANEARAMATDDEWEVWCLNLIPLLVDGAIRADRWFDLHQRHAQTPTDLRWIADCRVPIYVPPDLASAGPRCVEFPLADVEAFHRRSYWSCTFAYQIAFAMMLGFEEIGLFGVELAFGTMRERTVEWACVSWWMGYAEARGVRFHVPKRSWLSRHVARYGFEYDKEIQAVDRYVRHLDASESPLDRDGMSLID